MDNNKTPAAILFSSDSTPQYEKDIYNVIALPTNGRYRFRYKKEYIDINLLNHIKTRLIPGARILIAFRTNSAAPDKHIEPFMVPIRWAEIEEIEEIDKIVIIKFIAKDYPIFSSAFENACNSYESNVAFSKEYFINNNKNHYFVTESIPDIVSDNICRGLDNQEKAWIRIIEALSKYAGDYGNTGFFDKIFFKTMVNIPESTMCIEMKEGVGHTVKLVQYNSNEHSITDANVEIQYDPTVLISAYGDKDRIECRYDILDYTFIPQNISQEIETQVVFIFSSENAMQNDSSNYRQQSTKIRIPIRIKPSVKKRTLQNAIFSFFGALAIGLNGVFDLFDVTIPTWLGISLFSVGTVLLTFAGLFSKGE